MDRERRDYIAAWIEKAEQDLSAASIVLNSGYSDKPVATVCFHSQQAAEKYLKAYLVSLDIVFPRTHNIGQLIELGLPRDDSLASLIETDTLSPYGVDIRYPDDFSIPTEDEAREALSMALKIKEYVKARLRAGE